MHFPQEFVNELIEEEELPYIFSFFPKVVLAVVVSIFDELYKHLKLNSQKNGVIFKSETISKSSVK